MIDTAKWQEDNTRHIAASVAVLRDRLKKQAGPEPVAASAVVVESQSRPEPQEQTQSVWRLFKRRQIAPSVTSPEVSPSTPASAAPAGNAPSVPPIAPSLEDVAAPSALVMLKNRLGLTAFERDLLVLCAAMELDTGMATLCARIQDGRAYPTFALGLTLLDEPSWEALSPERPLRYWRLVEINQPGGQPLTTSALRADERIVNYLKGLNYLDDRLAPMVWPMEARPDSGLPASQSAVVDTILLRLRQPPGDKRLPVVQMAGRDSASKEMIAAAVSAELGVRLYRLQTAMLPSQPADLESFARLWQRESLLLPAALYVEGGETDPARVQVTQLFLSRVNALVFFDTPDALSGTGYQSLVVDIRKPTPAEQEAAWTDALADHAAANPALLAGQFDLSLAVIRDVANQSLANASGTVEDRLWTGALAATRPHLDALAQHIEPKAKWDDLVLPPNETKLLHQIVEQVGRRGIVYDSWGFRDKSSRGLGISALFAGDSGTGKTMAAEVIANALRLNLYRIDLSAVVSKYIGETEKNLRRLFDAAEDGGAVLFFDEADALFGKRSEVKDSHDRYANIEINYLLQRMEAYRGLAVLATNMKSALDPAFLRRLRFIVTFPFPGPAERSLIWRQAFPSRTPTGALDFDRLARLNVTGGNIYSIALNAAFLAAQAGVPVSMPVVLDAARTEFRKLERPINEADFRWQGAA